MNNYQFIAISKDKQKIKGNVEANDVEELRKIISYHDYYLVKYKIKTSKEIKFIEKNVKSKDIKNLCKNTSLMLKSGQSLIRVITLLEATTRNKGIKEFLSYTKEQMPNGMSFTECVKKYEKYFSKMFISMVEIGEKTATLQEVFANLARYYDNNEKIKSKILNALFYPLILLGMSIIVFFVMCVVVLPMYSEIFMNNTLELPLYTRILFSTSLFIKDNLLFVLLGVALVFLIIILILISKKGRKIMINILSSIIGIKEIFKLINLYTISICLDIMLSNKFSLIDSLEVLLLSLNDNYLVNKFKWISDEIKRGQSLSNAISSVNYFPKMFCEMVKNGEYSNSLGEEMHNSSDYYFEKIKETLSKLATLVEPIMIISISFFIGMIMFSVFVPMLNLLSAFR